MFGNPDLHSLTSKHFEDINFNEINDRWIEDLLDNDFTDGEDNQMTPNILFSDDSIRSLNNLCVICEKWCSHKTSDFLSDSSMSNNADESTPQEDVLWTYLNGLDVTVKQILGLVYLLCSRAKKKTSSVDDKELGLASAKFYFHCLRVPGSSAYSVFHQNLFHHCLDCLQMPNHTPETKDTVYFWRDFECLLPIFISTLDALVPLLSDFHLGSDGNTTEYTIQKLVELVACDTSNTNLNFDFDYLSLKEKDRRRRFSSTYLVTSLAYQGMLAFIRSDMNGDKESNCSQILAGLNNHILCVKVKKASTISHKFAVIKDNAVSFIRYNLNCNKELFSKPSQITLKRLCLSVSDKADFRSAVSNAISSVMFDLSKEDLIDFIQWLLLLSDSAEGNNRTFAIEALGQLLSDNVPTVSKEDLPEDTFIYTTPIPIIFAILTRCDDISASVRARALTVISLHTKTILNSLEEVMKDENTKPSEEFEQNVFSNLNGDHRSFWYHLDSYRQILDEIAAILHRRSDDSAVAARKAALQALENLITFDVTYLKDEFAKLFFSAAKDATVSIRKQVIQSLTTILDSYPDNTLAQECWLKCIFPLVHDPENSVQAKALSVMEDRFLRHIFSSSDILRNSTFSLLEKLSHGKYLSHQRYLQKAFSFWQAEKKLGSLNVSSLETSFKQGRVESVWFYLAIYSGYGSRLPGKICDKAVEAFQEDNNWANHNHMKHIIKLLGSKSTYSNLSQPKLKIVYDILEIKLKSFAAPVEILPLMIDTLNKVQKCLDKNEDFSEFANDMIQNCKAHLSKAASSADKENLPLDGLIPKCMTVIKEICHLFPDHISCIKSSLYPFYALEAKKIPPEIRAHAFAAAGMIAIQDEVLAKDLIPILAKELKDSPHEVIRNNSAIILITMCKRYTALTERYLAIICRCFKDPVYIIRYQTITLLVNLLQEGYIKWKGNLFFCLLTTIIDKQESIQELGKYCLCELLLKKKESIFADHFIDSIFVLNNYEPPDNELVADFVRELKIFSLTGPNQQEERIQLYKFMLTYMNENSKTFLIPQLSRNIILNVSENVYALNEKTTGMIQDCFAILSSSEIRVFDIDCLEDDIEEGDREKVAAAEKEARKLILIGPIIPALISLKTFVMSEKSDLLNDIIHFLKDILQDYKSEIGEILAGDKFLEKTLRYEFQNEMLQQEREITIREDVTPSVQPVARLSENPVNRSLVESESAIKQIIDKKRTEVDTNSSTGGVKRFYCPTPKRVSMLRKSTVQNQDIQEMEIDSLPTTSSSEPSLTLTAGVNFSSTPRVVLNRLKMPNTPDISSLVFPTDADSC